MLIKVCGMREPDNIAAVARLAPDMMGFIFYERSPRWAGELSPEDLDVLPTATRRVGVFVDAPPEYILATARRYGLDLVQLHGAETPADCTALRGEGLGVMKAFGVASREDVVRTVEWEGSCDYYVFDTRSTAHGDGNGGTQSGEAQSGGTGRKFDHRLLEEYRGRTPYLLSGGLAPEDAGELADGTADPRRAGFDINSRFETAPGVKDPQAIEQFINTIKNKKQ